jgi:hypothetical protein
MGPGRSRQLAQLLNRDVAEIQHRHAEVTGINNQFKCRKRLGDGGRGVSRSRGAVASDPQETREVEPGRGPRRRHEPVTRVNERDGLTASSASHQHPGHDRGKHRPAGADDLREMTSRKSAIK